MKAKYFFLLLNFLLFKTTFSANYDQAMKTSQFMADVINEKIAPLKLQLDAGFNVNEIASQNGWTSLHYAVMRNKSKSVQFLIENGADPEIKDKFGETAFDLANKYADEKIKKFLSQYHDNSSFADNGSQKPLQSIEKPNIEKKSIGVHFRNSFVNLCENDFIGFVESFKNQFKEEVLRDKSYFLRAIKCRKNSVIKYFLDKSNEFKIDVDFTDESGYAALDYALTYRDVELIDLLSKCGASKSRILQHNNTTLIEYVVMNAIF